MILFPTHEKVKGDSKDTSTRVLRDGERDSRECLMMDIEVFRYLTLP